MGGGKRVLRGVLVALALLLAWLVLLAVQIDRAGEASSNGPADAALVLGAAVNGDQPSPVFQARIDHAVNLYRAGKVRLLVFTGGVGEGEAHAESLVGRDYAIRAGVPANAIRTEAVSRTTRENLLQARPILQAEQAGSVLIVSDPLHMKRALRMADDLGIAAEGSPTPTTRYHSWRTKAGFLWHEIFYYNLCLLRGD